MGRAAKPSAASAPPILVINAGSSSLKVALFDRLATIGSPAQDLGGPSRFQFRSRCCDFFDRHDEVLGVLEVLVDKFFERMANGVNRFLVGCR